VARLGDITVPPELLRKAIQGDEAAQAVVYTSTAGATFALIRRLIANRAMAEDLFQDTMMTLFERLSEFRGEAPLGAWLRQIAVSKCLMYLRSPWHRVRLQLENESEPEIHHGGLSALITPAPAVEGLDIERALQSRRGCRTQRDPPRRVGGCRRTRTGRAGSRGLDAAGSISADTIGR
jgi:RNA polymerase sigma factor (sigma-70 family)